MGEVETAGIKVGHEVDLSEKSGREVEGGSGVLVAVLNRRDVGDVRENLGWEGDCKAVFEDDG